MSVGLFEMNERLIIFFVFSLIAENIVPLARENGVEMFSGSSQMSASDIEEVAKRVGDFVKPMMDRMSDSLKELKADLQIVKDDLLTAIGDRHFGDDPTADMSEMLLRPCSSVEEFQDFDRTLQDKSVRRELVRFYFINLAERYVDNLF